MNSIIIKGRISSEIECRVTDTGKEVYNFSVAVNRRFNREQTDFFNIVAWGKLGAFISQYFIKGQEILLGGEMQCRTWKADDGKNRYFWELIANDAEFCGSKSQSTSTPSDTTVAVDTDNFEEVTEEVPF